MERRRRRRKRWLVHARARVERWVVHERREAYLARWLGRQGRESAQWGEACMYLDLRWMGGEFERIGRIQEGIQ